MAMYIEGFMRWRVPEVIVNDRRILSSDTMLHKDHNPKVLRPEKILVVGLKGLSAKTN
jgi:hypothetical protein